MKTRWLGGMLVAISQCGFAQDANVSLGDLIDGAKQWAADNLDTNVLNALPEVDQQQAQQFFRDLQQQFQGEYIINLAALRQPAETLVPFLELHEETQPYAAWLKPRLDYLQVADELRLTIPPPATAPGQPPPILPNPPPDQEREIWVKKISNRPWPPAATNYVPRLKPIFSSQDVPPQLVWIAEVESSFDARARSPAGAAGLFQLMPDTAKRYGLSMWPRDQRLQIEPSATASAQYLKYLHERFKDWRLALAAYNAGEGTVQSLLDRYHAQTYDQIASHLPAETQLFVPKVEATLKRREGVKLAELEARKG